MVQPTEQVPIIFFGIDFPSGRGVVEFEFLHRVFDRANFFGEIFEVGPFVAFCFAFGEFLPVFLEVDVVPFYGLCIVILDLGSEQVIVVRPKQEGRRSATGRTTRHARGSTDHP